MTDDHLELVQIDIKHPFYYIEYPDNVSENWWKDGVGEWKHMADMGLDHLKACIKKVEKDISHLEQSGRPSEVIEAIVPLAKQKLSELRNSFQKKIKL